LALVAPGTALGASLTTRSLKPEAPVRVQSFDLAGLHWSGSGSVFFRTRSLAGRWSRWQPGLAEDDLPDVGTEGLRPGRRIGSPYWTGGADAIEYRARGRGGDVRGYLVRSGGEARRVKRPQVTEM